MAIPKKKIALVIYSLGRGGAEKVLADLSLVFAQQHEVTLIIFDGRPTCRQYGGQLIDLNLPSVQGVFSKLWNLLKRAYVLRKLFKQHSYDHIISFMEHASFPAILASDEVTASNHCNPNTFSKQEWLFSRWLYPKAKRLVAVSERGMRIFQQRINVPQATYLHNPIDIALIQSKQQQVTELPEQPYILAVGRLCREKNFQGLLRAYAQSETQKAYRLIILGEGYEREALEKLIVELNIQASVELKGFCDNPYPYIKQAHYLVLSSIAEGFPVAIAESLACGCPVIATRCETGPDEIIQHEHNGLLVAVNDEKALTQAMDRLSSDALLYQHLRQHTQASVQHLDIHEVAKQWLAL